jgi:hypothetical protein
MALASRFAESIIAVVVATVATICFPGGGRPSQADPLASPILAIEVDQGKLQGKIGKSNWLLPPRGLGPFEIASASLRIPCSTEHGISPWKTAPL